ncbi:BadF/BadG/BcrA/BcrD ATPase family protein [Solirubrobacter pauli]|uniref:BadF/BadG/BcrA/BcrD ATPase family protein n=1 Tax=Solirubrobacter pauli TaxID=166793 RepID=A0A660L0E3_9ACTN|nr:BadF/BadG/BcrA/BcrD ATPase family protein [Solirubrobacter pauli]RKQ86352.1 BadF/BadG/BcrA/BcrD ATPase family protein [Solirubrobacter pauli]
MDGAVVERSTAPGLARAGRDWSALRELVARHAPDVVAAGLTGWDGADLGVPMVVTNDAVTAHLGALGGEPGAVVVAGTGAIALAGSEAGWARADGWGTLLGDAGGGFWIARRALDQALRAVDGRGGSSALRDVAAARFGPLEEIARAVYDAPDPVATVAAFTRDVAELAHGGEATAVAIFVAAGAELAHTVTAALKRAGLVAPREPLATDPGQAGPDHAGLAGAGQAGPDHAGLAGAGQAGPGRAGRGDGAREPVVVSWSGGVFSAGDLILDPLRAALPPGVVLRAPLGDGLDGAARLLDAPTLFSDLIRRP